MCNVHLSIVRIPAALLVVLGLGSLLSDFLEAVGSVRLLRSLRLFLAKSRQLRKRSLRQSASREVQFGSCFLLGRFYQTA